MASSRRGWLAVSAALGWSGVSCTLVNSLDRYQSGLGTSGDSDAAADAAEPIEAAARCDPTRPFGAPVLVSELRSSGADIVSDLSLDEQTLYFSSNRGGSGVHLYYATRSSEGPWVVASQELFPRGVGDDWSVTVSRTTGTAVVASSRADGGDVDLYVATRASPLTTFGPLALAAGTNSPADDQTPRWSADGKTLYFDSTRGGSRALYRVSVDGSSFGAPQAIAELNTSAFEAAPLLTADELTIYFTSQRSPTAPGDEGDIYVATRGSREAPFSNVAPVENVNSPEIDAPGYLTEDGCTLYLSSAREGEFHIYVATRPPP
jgi:Tol biopolymer transport system component